VTRDQPRFQLNVDLKIQSIRHCRSPATPAGETYHRGRTKVESMTSLQN
jgi:hypothetical protein